MIKRIKVSEQKTPKVLNGKQSYSNKGNVATRKSKSFSTSTKATPGVGKGKARGMGAAEYGGKFSGVY